MGRAQIIVTSCSRRGLELEQVKIFLKANGFTVSDDDWHVDPDADVMLLSTCGFTQAAEDFGFETLRRVQAEKNPAAQIIFGGCIPEINPERVSRTFDGPTFSPQSYTRLNEILGATRRFETCRRPNTFGNGGSGSLIGDARKAVGILKTFDGSLSGLEHIVRRLGNGVRRKLIRTRYANLKCLDTFYIQIQEGCSMACSYCAITKAIGPLRSRPPGAILDEFRTGLDEGYRQIQLVGDNAGSYGRDIGTHMGELLERMLAVDGDFELDLTDINPAYLHLVFQPVRRLAVERKLGRLYVPIQTASRRILRLMRRDCDMDAVERMLIEIKRSASPSFRLGTSLIVGFPSETMDEVDDTIRFCDRVGFDWVWCHSFSARAETAAAKLPGKIPDEEILRRARFVKSRLKGRSLVTTADDSVGSRTCQG